MAVDYDLGVTDYIVLAAMLIISIAIGIAVKVTDKKQTSNDFLMAGKNAPMFPVVLSIVVSIFSALELLASSEVYRYGSQMMIMTLGIFIGFPISSLLFVPVFFNTGVTTAHEFLEIRYGRKIQFAVSGLFIIQMVFFMSAVLYGSVLALSAVTDFSVEISVVIIGAVCTFYCSLGGLKAVLWTDVFQALLMFTNVIIIYTKGVLEAGGVSSVLQKASQGNRIHFFNLDTDPTARYTFWNSMTRSLVGSMAYFGCSQIEVQRMLSLSSSRRAKCSLLWSIIPVTFLFLMCQCIGLILYAIFYECDPIQDSGTPGITRYDQLVPFYIVSRMGSVPGLTGLCAAGIFSGALSTVSSALNSLSTVTVVDFLRPLWQLTERRTLLVARVLSVVYGVICIGFTFAISNADSLLAVTSTLVSIMEGPMLAIFLIGVLSRKADEKCALFGILLGMSITCWLGYGIVFSGYIYPSLPLDVSGCPSQLNSSSGIFGNTSFANCTHVSGTCSAIPLDVEETFSVYKLSFMWVAQIGCLTTFIGVIMAVLATGWRKNAIPADSKCLSPVTRLWMKKNNVSSKNIKELDTKEGSLLKRIPKTNSEEFEQL